MWLKDLIVSPIWYSLSVKICLINSQLTALYLVLAEASAATSTAQQTNVSLIFHFYMHHQNVFFMDGIDKKL